MQHACLCSILFSFFSFSFSFRRILPAARKTGARYGVLVHARCSYVLLYYVMCVESCECDCDCIMHGPCSMGMACRILHAHISWLRRYQFPIAVVFVNISIRRAIITRNSLIRVNVPAKLKWAANCAKQILAILISSFRSDGKPCEHNAAFSIRILLFISLLV